MMEIGCVCMKKIITISLYLLASILLIMCFFGFYPRFLEVIKGSYKRDNTIRKTTPKLLASQCAGLTPLFNS